MSSLYGGANQQHEGSIMVAVNLAQSPSQKFKNTKVISMSGVKAADRESRV